MENHNITFVDSHAHLTSKDFNSDRDAIISALSENNIEAVISVSDSTESFELLEKLTEKYPQIYATAGFHPHYADNYQDDDFFLIKKFLKLPKVVAIGEIGLDYHYNYSKKDVQKSVFETLVELAIKEQMPMVIHNRKSSDDTISILKNFQNEDFMGVIHCFDSDIATAKLFLDMGFYISFSGIVCFPKAHELRETLAYVPIDRLLIETDCPYLAPPPMRGKRNQPAFVKYVAEKAAEIKNMNIQEIAGATKKNTYKLFNINF